MIEIRLHGRGGQGVVKAAQTLVQALVAQGRYAQFIPFFGVERKGSPVYGFVRIDDKPLRLRTQVYEPHCLIALDEALMGTVPIFDGLRDKGILIINSSNQVEKFETDPRVGILGIVDGNKIAAEYLGPNMPPNTAILGAFAKTTGWIDWGILQEQIKKDFGAQNASAAQKAYDSTVVCRKGDA
ncbi:MAG: 2-oxoacid:acceptor oxidoreductase family protein [Dehalobacterium sp.]